MNSTTIIEKGRTVLQQEARAISRMAERLDGNFAKAVAALAECKGKVIISGMGKSGIVGQKMAATNVVHRHNRRSSSTRQKPPMATLAWYSPAMSS